MDSPPPLAETVERIRAYGLIHLEDIGDILKSSVFLIMGLLNVLNSLHRAKGTDKQTSNFFFPFGLMTVPSFKFYFSAKFHVFLLYNLITFVFMGQPPIHDSARLSHLTDEDLWKTVEKAVAKDRQAFFLTTSGEKNWYFLKVYVHMLNSHTYFYIIYIDILSVLHQY